MAENVLQKVTFFRFNHKNENRHNTLRPPLTTTRDCPKGLRFVSYNTWRYETLGGIVDNNLRQSLDGTSVPQGPLSDIKQFWLHKINEFMGRNGVAGTTSLPNNIEICLWHLKSLCKFKG
jgi:hypothetical protein